MIGCAHTRGAGELRCDGNGFSERAIERWCFGSEQNDSV